VNLGNLRIPQVAATAAHTVLAVPLGATEQHGPHLPLDTDTTIATELCRRLAQRLPAIRVAPAIPYGSSGEHAHFPGTLSIGQTALRLVITELVRSADAFAGVVLVNGHGGNLQPLRQAVATLRAEGRNVLAWSPTGPANDSHAGHTETSAILRIRPDDVDLTLAEPGNTEPLPDLIDQLREHGTAAVSSNGVLGDPTTANPDHGEQTLHRWADALTAHVTTWLQAQ
jgi:mycofactocin system creatininase family protein